MIELVIKIPEEVYQAILDDEYSRSLNDRIYNATKTGTPLHKGHGKLFDEKEIDAVVNGVFYDNHKHSPKTFLNVIHNQCIEAVGADRTESRDKDDKNNVC